MERFVRSALVLALLACHAPRAEKRAAAAAAAFTRQHAKHKLHARVAGHDCRVLAIETETALDTGTVESIQYGIGDYSAFGGADQFARKHGFRAEVYRDSAGGLWTYGATTRKEAQAMPRCR